LAGKLDKIKSEWDQRTALGVVLAAKDYPQSPRKGDVITIKDIDSENVKIFHAGTSKRDEKIVTSGGRVLCVTALGETVAQARDMALKAGESISFTGKQFRTDIGNRAIKR